MEESSLLREREIGEKPIDFISFLSKLDRKSVEIYFQYSSHTLSKESKVPMILINLCSCRKKLPDRIGPNHFRIVIEKGTLYQGLISILDLIIQQASNLRIVVYTEWPPFSWIKRILTQITMTRLIKLPKLYPDLSFIIDMPRMVGMSQPINF